MHKLQDCSARYATMPEAEKEQYLQVFLSDLLFFFYYIFEYISMIVMQLHDARQRRRQAYENMPESEKEQYLQVNYLLLYNLSSIL